MKKTTLLIMAAGIGSRFGGGIKQLEPVGLHDEIIMDYSIHDAIIAGFNKIIFVIRKDIEDDFKERIGDRVEAICGACNVEIAYAFQDLAAIPEDVRRAAKVMVVSYPANPICKTAPDSFYEELITFARENEILIIHDNAYSDIIYDGREGKSFLSFPGAKEVGVEFYSLSKSYNYTGARMSFVIGNPDVIALFKRFRSQIDYGIFLPVQMGAIAALSTDDAVVKEQCRKYQERRDALCGGLRAIGWNIPDSEGTMFAWGPLPEGYTDSNAFVMELMERTGVICTPGSSFGSLGEGHVRFALVLPPEQIKEAIESIRQSGILG